MFGMKWRDQDFTAVGQASRARFGPYVFCSGTAWLCIPSLAPRELSSKEWETAYRDVVDAATERLRVPLPPENDHTRHFILSAGSVYCGGSLVSAKCCPRCRTALALSGKTSL